MITIVFGSQKPTRQTFHVNEWIINTLRVAGVKVMSCLCVFNKSHSHL